LPTARRANETVADEIAARAFGMRRRNRTSYGFRRTPLDHEETQMTVQLPPSPVKVVATDAPDQPTRTPELEQLYRDFETNLLLPLWTEIGYLMPHKPGRVRCRTCGAGTPCSAGRKSG
jgi:hypothetical protein